MDETDRYDRVDGNVDERRIQQGKKAPTDLLLQSPPLEPRSLEIPRYEAGFMLLCTNHLRLERSQRDFL